MQYTVENNILICNTTGRKTPASEFEMEQAERITKLETMLKTMTYDVIELDQGDGNVLGMMQEDPDMAEFLEDESVQELIQELEEDEAEFEPHDYNTGVDTSTAFKEL